jgi:hypothetical protein
MISRGSSNAPVPRRAPLLVFERSFYSIRDRSTPVPDAIDLEDLFPSQRFQQHSRATHQPRLNWIPSHVSTRWTRTPSHPRAESDSPGRCGSWTRAERRGSSGAVNSPPVRPMNQSSIRARSSTTSTLAFTPRCLCSQSSALGSTSANWSGLDTPSELRIRIVTDRVETFLSRSQGRNRDLCLMARITSCARSARAS